MRNSMGLLSFADSRPAKMRRSILVLLLYLGTSGSEPQAAAASDDLDWASGCRERNGCECKWVHGKRTATCPPNLNLDRLPEFPAPDRVQVSVTVDPSNRGLVSQMNHEHGLEKSVRNQRCCCEKPISKQNFFLLLCDWLFTTTTFAVYRFSRLCS